VIHLRLEGGIGDFFICASERQRDFWLGVLLASGRVNTVTYAQDPTLRTLIDVVPFGIPSVPPNKRRTVLKGVQPGIGPDDKVLLWNGGLWQWFDPLLLIDALVQVLNVRDDVRLFFAAGRHFDQEAVPEMPIYTQTVARCRELDLLDRYVFFGDWIPYDERGGYLLEADLGVSVHRSNIESRFASRTRLLDCVWAGLPVVSTAGDPLSDWIAENGIGRAVPHSDSELLAQAILEMLADDHLRERVVPTARSLHSDLAWTQVIEPIASFLDRVAFAPDGLEAARTATRARQTLTTITHLQARVQELEQHAKALEQIGQNTQAYAEQLEAHIEAINRGRFMRLMKTINSIFGRE
jgi:glycosyltransferase involved in cell wall biosynthesis/FtsZ-binding cell division protein ZapB